MTESVSIISSPSIALSDLGPCLHERGVTYRVWAFGHESVVAHIQQPNGNKYQIELEQENASGYFVGLDPRGAAQDLYQFSIDGANPIPDLISHYQPCGAFGPSMVVDAHIYPWKATDWHRPRWNGQVIYECHIGTFTSEGTFRAATEKIDYLVSLGITALEIMPVCEWSGKRNWGYDGTFLFAPSHAYGTPDDFRALIDVCHLHEIAIILDIVFNHLGPEGNFSHQYSSYYFHEGKDNPWGQNFNLDGKDSEPVRAMLLRNIRYWMEDFRIDGLRMDATHMVHDFSPIHLLSQAADIVHQYGGFIIAEDDRNDRLILEPHEKKGWNFDGVWSDDFHHSMRVSQTGEQQYFLSMFRGDVEEIGEILRKGWLYSGQYSEFHQKERGTPAQDFPPQSFIFCISNHDQVGNRFEGERLHKSISPRSYRALSLLLCLVPYTPLIFMGQEWGASSPFHFFTHASDELGAKIMEARKQEFLKTKFVLDLAELEKMSSPQDEKIFIQSKLNWPEIYQNDHGRLLKLYQAGLRLRKELFRSTNPERKQWEVETVDWGVVIHYRFSQRHISVKLYLKHAPVCIFKNQVVLLRSNAPEFSGATKCIGPETIVSYELQG